MGCGRYCTSSFLKAVQHNRSGPVVFSPIMAAIVDNEVLLTVPKERETVAKFSLLKNMFWSSWAEDATVIDSLNEIVQTKIKSFEKSGAKLGPEVLAALHQGKTVYLKRLIFFPLLMSCLSLYWISNNSFWENIAIFFVSYFWYDIFSGMLHIVLDNPEFIEMPILGQPCLEFQWHHHIPYDIATKTLLSSCADLNLTIILLLALYVILPMPFQYRSTTALSLVGTKTLMAYFGQFCHKMSHTYAHKRPQWVSYLQECGIMVTPRMHNVHHHHHDKHFCIGSGIFNPMLDYVLENVTRNKFVWLAIFSICVVVDIPIFNFFFSKFHSLSK